MHVRSPRVILLAACLALSWQVSGRAQDRIGLSEPPPSPQLVVRPFDDSELNRLLDELDRFFALPLQANDPLADPDLQLWKFMRWMQSSELSAAQERRVVGRLDALAEAHPQYAALFARERAFVPALTIGKPAPEIVGRDLDGVEFKLSDYRGKVTVVNF
jgi:hypothetical protein